MDIEKLFRIQWNEQIDERSIYTKGETIEAHGNAYPGVKITATLADQRVSVQTNSQGDWAISLKALKGGSLQLTFESLEDGKTIVTRTWKVE
jgi:phosphatidate phosphatase APP1